MTVENVSGFTPELVEKMQRAIEREFYTCVDEAPRQGVGFKRVALTALTIAEINQDLRTVEFRLALKRIAQSYPLDTIAGRLAANVLAKYPNPFENVVIPTGEA
jgi:hypothetical protein